MSDTENTPVPADDTEGHRLFVADQPGQGDQDDVQGHRHIKATEERRARVDGTEAADDVEGHRSM